MLTDRLGRLGLFLWSGWAGLAALSLLAALWQIGHEAYGDFILPAPAATLRAGIALLAEPRNWHVALVTVWRAPRRGHRRCRRYWPAARPSPPP